MLFAHHTPTTAQQALVHEQGLMLPDMPAFAPARHAAAPPGQQQAYASSYTCQSGHGIVAASVNGSDHVLPHWPAEVDKKRGTERLQHAALCLFVCFSLSLDL
jgi:hypothetical protein